MPRSSDPIVDLGLDDETVSQVESIDTGRTKAVEDLSLVVMSSGFAATYRLPPEGEVTIGRAKSVEIYVDDPSVSRQHAIVAISPELSVRDLGSSNGTRVGGITLEPDVRHPVRIGDAITVGAATILLQPAAIAIKPRRFWSGDDLQVRIDEECARANRAGAPFTVAILRVDRLALDLGVRQLLARRLRSSDVVGEYGPAEYAILLTDSTHAQARVVMDRIASDLAEREIKAHWGAAEFPRDATVAHQLITAAQIAAQDAPAESALLPASTGPVFADPQMLELLAFVKMIAAGELAVLILGETGVGKEVIAEEVHRLSARASGPFVRLNCAALSEQLLESELFGHEKGAFTSAEKAKPGLLETAAAGTVFLDEIGELPMKLQVKLLRVLEDKQVLRVGGLKPRQLDVRFIAATNRDLEQQATRGLFREDLYYRLAGATVTIPPLRERVCDIGPLARMFLRNAASHLGGRILEIDDGAMAALVAHTWPGNIRELRNVIERAALICGAGPITFAHLPALVGRGAGSPRSRPSETERPAAPSEPAADRIVEVLNACGGNQSRAAKELGISRAALIRRLEKIGVVRPRKQS